MSLRGRERGKGGEGRGGEGRGGEGRGRGGESPRYYMTSLNDCGNVNGEKTLCWR